MTLSDLRSQLAIQDQLVRDTFRQARTAGISGMMLGITAVCVAFCLSISVSGDVPLHDPEETVYFLPASSHGLERSANAPGARDGARQGVDSGTGLRDGVETLNGRMSLGFGSVSFDVSRERRDSVRFLELLLGGGVAGTFGLLLALVWTSGFAPGFLEPGVAAVMLAKPVARWQLLLGKYVGVLTFLGTHASLFIAATWAAIGVRTGVWDATYWLCLPLLMIQFASFYSLSVLIAVVSRSTVACVFGSLLCWVLAWGINYGGAMASSPAVSGHLPPSTAGLAHAAYWISPKPIDMGLILFNSLASERDFEKPPVFTSLESGGFSPSSSIASSVLIAWLILALAMFELERTDY